MEQNDFLSPKIHKSIQSLWILLLIFVAVDFSSNYFYPEGKHLTLAIVLDFLSGALGCLLFSWYFVVNRRWKSLLMVLPLLIMCFFFMKEIRDTIDYYMPFEKIINSDTLRKYTYLLIELAAVFVLAKRYMVEENVAGKGTFTKLFFLNLGFFSLYNADMGMIEQFISSGSFSSKTTEFFVTLFYYVLTSVKTISMFGAFLFLINCIAKRESIYTFSDSVLQFANRHFGVAVLIVISCVIFSFGYLLENAISLEMDFFGKKLTIFGWINNIAVVILFVISCRFTGQFLQLRSHLKQKYYGVVGSSVWIPVINIISLLMIKFDDKIKFLSPGNFEKAKKIHLVAASLLILFFYRNDILDNDKRLEGLLMSAIYIAAFCIVSYLKKYNWLFPAILAAIVMIVKIFPFYKDAYDTEFVFKDYALDPLGHTFSIAMVLSGIVFYGIYYIAFQTMNTRR